MNEVSNMFGGASTFSSLSFYTFCISIALGHEILLRIGGILFPTIAICGGKKNASCHHHKNLFRAPNCAGSSLCTPLTKYQLSFSSHPDEEVRDRMTITVILSVGRGLQGS